METIRRKRMRRIHDYQNFKRRVWDGEISPDRIAVQWRINFPNGRISKELEWRTDADFLILFDLCEKQPRLALSASSGALLVPPREDEEPRPLQLEDEAPKSTPQLTPDTLRLIFSHLRGWRDKLACRGVCRQWRRIITEQAGVWKLSNSVGFENFKSTLLLGIRDYHGFFLDERPDLFVDICRLLHAQDIMVPMVGNTTMMVGPFTLKRNALFMHKRVLRMQDFLEEYRNRIS